MNRIGFASCLTMVVLCCSCQSGTERSSSGANWLGGGGSEDWTILCREFVGPQHEAHGEQFGQTLSRTPGVRTGDVRMTHDDINGVSRLYYGIYRRQLDPTTQRRSTPRELTQDLRLIQELGDNQGTHYFLEAYMTPMVVVEQGPPEWALSRAPGVYSLQVAIFFPEGGFKEIQKAALDLVRDLRQSGYEAYYHHEASSSTVTVGSFDGSAVMQFSDGRAKNSAQVEALRHKDPRFAYNYVNGQVRTKKAKGVGGQDVFVESPSFLVQIPKSQSAAP